MCAGFSGPSFVVDNAGTCTLVGTNILPVTLIDTGLELECIPLSAVAPSVNSLKRYMGNHLFFI